MLCMLITYDAQGRIVSTLNHMVDRDDKGNVIGLIDFEAHELAGGKLRDIVDSQRLDMPVPKGIAKQILGRDPEDGEAVKLPPDHPFRLAHETVVGATTWPEWLGTDIYAFKVELDDRKRAKALVHRNSGHRRERADIEAAIAERINDAKAEAKKRGDELRKLAKAKKLPDSFVDAIADPEPEPADCRDLLGGPDRPLQLDDSGRTRPKAKSARPNLPVVGMGSAQASSNSGQRGNP